MNSSYYTGIEEVDKRLRELYYLQGLTEQMIYNSYFGDEKYLEEMEVLRFELRQLHSSIIRTQDNLLLLKGTYTAVADTTIQILKNEAETFREYLVALGLMF